MSPDSFKGIPTSIPHALKVQPSAIAGKGVFTHVDIHANCDFYAAPMGSILHEHKKNCLKVTHATFIDDPHILNYLNHSCMPNSELVIRQTGIFLHSLRPIAAGEEITIDYFLTEEQNNLIPCNCKTALCRGFCYMT